MSIRLILSIALLAATQCAYAETFIKHKNTDTVIHDTVDANSQCDMIYEQPGQRSFMTDATYMSICNWTMLILKQDTRVKLGRAILTYMPSNKNHSMEKIDARRRALSII